MVCWLLRPYTGGQRTFHSCAGVLCPPRAPLNR